MYMKTADLQAFEALMSEYGCTWKNRGRISNDWKAKIFERDSDGKQIALYDRKKGFQIRLEVFTAELPEITYKKNCPKAHVFDNGESKFKKGRGTCVVAKDISSVKNVLEVYFEPEKAVSDTFEGLIEAFDFAVEQSRKDEIEKRRQRLKTAEKEPKKRTVKTTVFDRNPDVVAERLYLANGFCQKCKEKAPFTRASNGQPYLEVHHIISLSNGGDDAVENTIALCPNCHRENHYG